MTHVLVVDDDLTVRDVVRRYLERSGHQVSLADNGEEALRWIDEHKPDLVVLDLMLPGMDGLEVCHRLRQHSTVPVVMLTALGEEENLHRRPATWRRRLCHQAVQPS
jgi:DNA-binding response OmpR family regulator